MGVVAPGERKKKKEAQIIHLMFTAGTYSAAWGTQNITNSSTVPQPLVQCCDDTHDKRVTRPLFDFFSWHFNLQSFSCWNNINDITVLFHVYSHNVAFLYKVCMVSICPFLISREPVKWPWCNLAVSQRRPYCASVNSHSPVGLVSRQWDAVDWAYVLCDCHIHNDWMSTSASSQQCTCPFYSSRTGFFWQSITSPSSVSSPAA